jgi:hypothetical protein
VDVNATHAGDPVSWQRLALRPGRQEVDLGLLAEGSYAVVVGAESASAATAFDVLRDPRSRPR